MSEPLRVGDRVRWCKADLDDVANAINDRGPLLPWVRHRGTVVGVNGGRRVVVLWDGSTGPPLSACEHSLRRADA